MKNKNLLLFENFKIRRHWDEENALWYFSVVDVIQVLTESPRPRKYWNALKIKMLDEGSELSQKLGRLKMKAQDGKMRITDIANIETLLRLIQSVPSPKVEPLKLWFAKVAYERLEETKDPELSIDRAMQMYLNLGYSKEWINQRLKTIEIRKELTDEWEERGVEKGLEYAILTDELTKAWSGETVRSYKRLKSLRKESLRDNMTNIELILNMLAEVTTTEISKVKRPKDFLENKKVAKQGGAIAGKTRKNIEEEIGGSVISSKNAEGTYGKNKKKLK